jgi:hypothetical protein
LVDVLNNWVLEEKASELTLPEPRAVVDEISKKCQNNEELKEEERLAQQGIAEFWPPLADLVVEKVIKEGNEEKRVPVSLPDFFEDLAGKTNRKEEGFFWRICASLARGKCEEALAEALFVVPQAQEENLPFPPRELLVKQINTTCFKEKTPPAKPNLEVSAAEESLLATATPFPPSPTPVPTATPVPTPSPQPTPTETPNSVATLKAALEEYYAGATQTAARQTEVSEATKQAATQAPLSTRWADLATQAATWVAETETAAAQTASYKRDVAPQETKRAATQTATFEEVELPMTSTPVNATGMAVLEKEFFGPTRHAEETAAAQTKEVLTPTPTTTGTPSPTPEINWKPTPALPPTAKAF